MDRRDPGAGYESVLFTVQDGHLVGWFGEPGGPKYVVYAGPDGRGSLSVEPGPVGDWCGVEAGPGRGPARWDPKLASHPSTQDLHYLPATISNPGAAWHWEFRNSSDIDTLRRRYKPDLIHFIPDVGTRAAAGMAGLRGTFDPYVQTGWSVPSPGVFAHEIGHNLGGTHEPTQIRREGVDFEEYQALLLEHFRPYVFGHTDMTSCGKREGQPDWDDGLYCPATIMSYGTDARLDDDPRTRASGEPFYSSVRHKPNGWTIGKAGTSEVERLLHETVPIQAISGEAPWRAEQYPRRVTGARWTGRDTVRLDWSEDWRCPPADWTCRRYGRVGLASAEGANDNYSWEWDLSDPGDPQLFEWTAPNLAPILGADGAQVGVEISGLRPGGGYRIAVWAGPLTFDSDSTWIESMNSDIFHLKARGRVSGSPAAPSNLGARVTGPDSARLHWRDNSRVEDGHEVWYRKWSGDEPDEVWRRYGEPLSTRKSAAAAATRPARIAV